MSTSDDLTLDPSDWGAFRRLAHEALDDALGFVEGVRERPVWQPVSEEARFCLAEPLPMEEMPLEAVYERFKTSIFPYATGNIHPRFFGWVHGSGQVGNIVAETMAAAMNSNCGGRNHGAIYVELEVIQWCKELFGFPSDASGLLLSGTSMATLVALGVARNAVCSNVRANGFDSVGERLVVYTSEEVHESAVKALEILGFGTSALRRIGVDKNFSIDLDALKQAIAEDRASGRRPFCCIGSAGTVNSGAIDNLAQLADICAAEGLWFHVDGAFGALCMTSDLLRGRLKGIERADSLAFDFHKWAHVQYDAACLLVRNAELHRAAYATRPSYLQRMAGGLAGGCDWPCDLGPELSRGFRALKIWFAFKQHGLTKIGKLIEQNCDQAAYLAARVSEEPDLELVAPVNLNIVCFRAKKSGLNDAALARLNEDIVVQLQTSGVAAPSTTKNKGVLAIRVNITNHRTRYSDLDILVDAVLASLHSKGAIRFVEVAPHGELI